MEIVLKKPVEELVPELIRWNNKELMGQAKEALEKYKGMVYTDATMDLAKKDRAQLNKFSSSLNNERLRIKKIYEEPYLKFKSEVDEVIAEVDSVTSTIDAQIKDYEEDKKHIKEEIIFEIYRLKIGKFADFIPYERVRDLKWLNATTSVKSIEQEIEKVVSDAEKAMVAIEALKAGEDENQLKALYFRSLDLSSALTAHQSLISERQRISEMRELEKENDNKLEGKEKGTILEINFRVTGTLKELRGLKTYLKANNIKYSAI